jgi:hypothetical protein
MWGAVAPLKKTFNMLSSNQKNFLAAYLCACANTQAGAMPNYNDILENLNDYPDAERLCAYIEHTFDYINDPLIGLFLTALQTCFDPAMAKYRTWQPT